MKIKKSPIYLIVAALISIILVTGSPFQISSNLVENNGHLSIKIIGQNVYGQGDDGGGGDDGGDDSSDSDDSGDSDDGGDEESTDSSDESEESSDESYGSEEESNDDEDFLSNENVDRSINYEGEDEATETPEEKEAEEQEFVADMEDDLADASTPEEKQAIQADIAKAKETFAKNVQPYDEENDGYYGGPKDSEGNLLDRDDWPADAEYDNEDGTGPLKVDEKGFREYLKDRNIDLDEDYSSLSTDKQKELVKEYAEQIPIKKGPVIVKGNKCDGKWKDGKCEKDDDKPDKRVIVKKYYKDRDDDNNGNDNDVDDLAAYNMGYRNGKVDKINKMPFNDAFPFDDKDGKTWYQVGYRSGWDSGK